MNVRLTQLDGKFPNLALMKLSRFHRDQGDSIHFSRSPYRDMLEPKYGRVYGSAIFSFSADRVARFRQEFPDAVIGGTWNMDDLTTVEQFLGVEESERYDYSMYPDFDASIGFTARGCRLKCGFCVVPKKEGRPRSVNAINEIWRGAPWPRHIVLLDNDFFGQPRAQWEARVLELVHGKFRVCFSQGINIRMIDYAAAGALGALDFYNDDFSTRRLYTAWDNLGDEKKFFQGVDLLEKYGVSPRCLMVYMLIGYDPRETWDRVIYRFNKMVERGIRPYPMIYGDRTRRLLGNHTLAEFQRWAVRRMYMKVPFEHYDVSVRWRDGVDPDAGQLPLAI
jgi:hypothetical protein